MASKEEKMGKKKKGSFRIGRKTAFLSLVLGMAFSMLLTGCKDSDVLTEVLYNQGSPIIDYKNPSKIYQDADDYPADDLNARLLSQEEINEMDPDQVEAVFGEDGSTNEETNASRHGEANAFDNPAGAGDAAGEGEGLAPGVDGGKGEGENGNQDSSESNDQQEEKPKGPEGNGDFYDGSGEVEKLPQGERIAAVGQYALIVQMLAGEGALVATDSGFLGSRAGNGSAFPGEGVSNILGVWGGNGISSSQLDMEALLAANPDTVLAYGDTNLSQAQANALYAKGINVVAMPGMADADDMKQAVKAIGWVLKDLPKNPNIERDPWNMALEYIRIHDLILNNTRDTNGGWNAGLYQWNTSEGEPFWNTRYGLAQIGGYDGNGNPLLSQTSESVSGNNQIARYISEWSNAYVPGGEISTHNGTLTGINFDHGVGMVHGSWASTTRCYYMQAGGVCDLAAISNYYHDYYIPASFGYDVGIKENWRGLPLSAGWFSNNADLLSFRTYGFQGNMSEHNWTPYDGYNINFIVADTSMRDNLLASLNDPNGYYNPYTRSNGKNWYEKLESVNVYVMPEGLTGSWAGDAGRGGSWEGQGPESVFIAPWVYTRFYAATSMDTLKSWLDTYGHLFYRIENYSGWVELNL